MRKDLLTGFDLCIYRLVIFRFAWRSCFRGGSEWRCVAFLTRSSSGNSIAPKGLTAVELLGQEARYCPLLADSTCSKGPRSSTSRPISRTHRRKDYVAVTRGRRSACRSEIVARSCTQGTGGPKTVGRLLWWLGDAMPASGRNHPRCVLIVQILAIIHTSAIPRPSSRSCGGTAPAFFCGRTVGYLTERRVCGYR